jgi:membrane protease YdiL (CAAX protease family)
VGPTKEALADKTLILINVAAFVPVHLLTLALAWVVATRRGKYSLKKVIGWSWPPGFGPIKSAALAILLFGISAFILARFGGQETSFEKLLMSSRATALILAVVAATTAPLVEEIVYRGLLYSALHRAIGPVLAVLTVTSLFAVLHVPQYWPNFAAISVIVLLSLVLTIVRSRTGRLLPCFAIHLVFNGVSSLLIIFEPYLRALYHLYHPEPVGGLIRLFLSN